jgi:hypothetical protein
VTWPLPPPHCCRLSHPQSVRPGGHPLPSSSLLASTLQAVACRGSLSVIPVVDGVVPVIPCVVYVVPIVPGVPVVVVFVIVAIVVSLNLSLLVGT